jgi:hypothetical protein
MTPKTRHVWGVFDVDVRRPVELREFLLFDFRFRPPVFFVASALLLLLLTDSCVSSLLVAGAVPRRCALSKDGDDMEAMEKACVEGATSSDSDTSSNKGTPESVIMVNLLPSSPFSSKFFVRECEWDM